MTPQDIHCPGPEELAACHDGELSGPERARIDAHAASCASCAQGLARLRGLSELLGALPREEAPDALVRRVVRQATASGLPFSWRRLVFPLASAAVLLVGVMLLSRIVPVQQQAEEARRDSILLARPAGRSSSGPAAASATPAASPPVAESAARDPAPGMADPTPLDRARRDQPQPADTASGAAMAETEVKLEKRGASQDFAPEPPALPGEKPQPASALGQSTGGRAESAPGTVLAPVAKAREADEDEGFAGRELAAAGGGAFSAESASQRANATMGDDIQAQRAPGFSQSTPIPVAEGMTPPVLVEIVEPAWPVVGSKKDARWGQVVLECVVDDAGSVSVRRILRSSPPFDQAAIEAVRRWKYRPAIFQGHPQAVVINVSLDPMEALAPR